MLSFQWQRMCHICIHYLLVARFFLMVVSLGLSRVTVARTPRFARTGRATVCCCGPWPLLYQY
jgi:hypothetical protein